MAVARDPADNFALISVPGDYAAAEAMKVAPAINSRWHQDDLAAAASAGPDAVLLPKVPAADVIDIGADGKIVGLF